MKYLLNGSRMKLGSKMLEKQPYVTLKMNEYYYVAELLFRLRTLI